MRPMHFVLTVIGAPGSRVLNADLLDAAAVALGEAGASHAAPIWLDPGSVCEIPIESAMPKAVETAVHERLAGAPLDIAVLPTEGRRKSLLLADMESTIIAEEMLDEMAEQAGIRPQIAEITARSMAGKLDFEQAIKERVRLLTGLSAEVLERLRGGMTLNPGARTLVQTMRAHGAYTALVSGGFTHFTDEIRVRCGFDEARGNRLVLAEGVLSGAVAAPILGPAAKHETLIRLRAERGLDPGDTCAVGDGANDMAMIEAAGLGVAYRAKPVLREAAPVRIDHGDLTALLYLQGYRRKDFRD